MVRFLALIVAIVMFASQTSAQSNPSLTEAERGVRDDSGSAQHLRIQALDVRAHVVGHTADVTVEMVITAAGRGHYEANLALALPAGAVVNGYWLEIEGAMIPGQLLEAPKARNIYEDEVREGIDPGLAEVAGNRFTTRIFPIAANQPRRFRLRFAAAFDPVIGLALPFARDAVIERVAVEVTADGYAAAPAVRFAGQSLDLVRSGAGWRGQAELGQSMVTEGLTVTGGTLTGPMVVTRHSGGEKFFVLSDSAMAQAATSRNGGRLRVYWDRSLSHRAERTDLEAEVLVRIASETRASEIDLVTFASDRPSVQRLVNSAALRKALERVTYRGGTSLAGLDAIDLPAAATCVLVFDGKVTIDRAATFAPDCRVMVLTASLGADGARLDRIAQTSGGAVVRLVPGGETAALAALTAPTARPVSVHDRAGRRVETRALPSGPGQWLLVGPLPAGGVSVRLSNGDERRYATSGPAIVSNAPASLWAESRIAGLADDPSRHDEMADTALRYQVAGSGMSFLVLERPDQYLHAGLAPPAGFGKDWLAGYREAKLEWDEEQGEARQERLDYVVEQWSERRDWWAKPFAARPRAKRSTGFPVPVFAPPPPPPPPPPGQAPAPITAARAAAAADRGAESIVVTAQLRSDPLLEATRPRAAVVEIDLESLLTKRPYIDALEAGGSMDRLSVLRDQERRYGSVPTFYLDTAEWFRLKGDKATAALLLLSALELPTSDDETRQIVAFRLERDRAFDRAVEIAELLAAANAEFRPQPGRGLALALAARGRDAGRAGKADLERAFQLLVDAVLNPASSDFNGFEVVALMEANALIPLIEAQGGRWTLDRRLVGLLATDARIVIEWTADDADIDLWVDEPNGERVMYSNTLSSSGGQISNDMTDGYGPEEYAIRRAPAGSYGVRVNGYDADRINPNGPGHVLIRLQRDFAREAEEQELVDVDLSFQTGRDRNDELETTPVATLQVSR